MEGDSFFNTTANNSRRLRNVVEHEHGHGLGLRHVCPVDGTKLMEPFINVGFVGVQFDDIFTMQRLYGDFLEVHGSELDNDSFTRATPVSAPVSHASRATATGSCAIAGARSRKSRKALLKLPRL